MRVASRRWLRGPLLGPFAALGSIRAKPTSAGEGEPSTYESL
jgi:hypothetical protein